MSKTAAAEVAALLAEIEAVRFGSFRLKDGSTSPFYIDLRAVVSFPRALRSLGQWLAQRAEGISFDLLAGIPYAGLPLALAMALEMERPMIYPRKEAKEYGTQRQIEGRFQPGQRALVVDDVITSGGAKWEAVEALRAQGLVVEDVLVVIDRSRRGVQALAERGLRLSSLLTAEELVHALAAAGRIRAEELEAALAYLRSGAD
jgi:uridine monophosphate synthetase